MKIQGKSKKEIPKNVAVDLSLLSFSRCSKTLAWSSTMVRSGVCCSISATRKVLPHAGTAGSKVHLIGLSIELESQKAISRTVRVPFPRTAPHKAFIMESNFIEEAEENARVRGWSERTQFEKGDSITEGQRSRMSDYTHVHAKQNNFRELKEIRAQWDDNLKRDFYQSYGDITYLLDVKVEKPLIKALAQRWNVAYSCFTIGEEDKVYTKIPNDKSFTKKLASLTRATKQWASGQIEKNGDSFCISWRCLQNLIRVESKPKKKMFMFALGIYGLVIFPKVLGYIKAAVLDIVERLKVGVTPVPAGLSETKLDIRCFRGAMVGNISGLVGLWGGTAYSQENRELHQNTYTGRQEGSMITFPYRVVESLGL
ncbi:hypothetical protein GQ457_HM000090 [Hibiscus cannabinus]